MEAISMCYGSYQVGRLVNLAADPPGPGRTFCFRSRVKHLSRGSIPLPFRHLPVLGTIRNPYARYVSQYRFGTWKVATDTFPQLASRPDFPDVSFRDFVRLANQHLWLVDDRAHYLAQSIGWQTASLMQWYARPEALEWLRSGNELDATTLQTSLEPIVLLRMDRLNRDLYEAMGLLGYEPDKKDLILKFPKVYPEPMQHVPEDRDPERSGGRSDDTQGATTYKHMIVEMPEPDAPPWQSYYDAELKQFVRDRERLLFELFPQWDV